MTKDRARSTTVADKDRIGIGCWVDVGGPIQSDSGKYMLQSVSTTECHNIVVVVVVVVVVMIATNGILSVRSKLDCSKVQWCTFGSGLVQDCQRRKSWSISASVRQVDTAATVVAKIEVGIIHLIDGGGDQREACWWLFEVTGVHNSQTSDRLQRSLSLGP
jgi:hypothetical protein